MVGKVLVVDDEDTLRLTIKTRLASSGFETEDAVDGDEALEKLKQSRFDVVLLDINMPRMDGITALGIITELYPATDVIMLTGFADFSTAIECLKKGAKDYLVKPIDTTELVTRMRSLQRARTSEAALEEANRTSAAFLFDEVLNRAIRIHDSVEMVVKGSLGKLTKDQTAVLKAARDLSATITTEIKKSVDPKFLKAESMALARKPTGIEKIVEQAVARVAAHAKARGVTFDHKVDGKIPKTEVDASRLEEAIVLLVTGLVELSSKGGTIRVSVAQGKKDKGTESVELTLEASKVGDNVGKIASQMGVSLDATGSGFAKLDNAQVLLQTGKRVLEAHKSEVRTESTKGGLMIQCRIPLKQ
ncbi:MAG: response regulator [Ignavibacteriales bacterium]|nr:response regulator [Ignavibacteriales bacterium]